MHVSDLIIGLKLMFISSALALFSWLIYPQILDLLGLKSILYVTPPVFLMSSLILVLVGVGVVLASLLMEEKKEEKK